MVIRWSDEDGVYIVDLPDFPNCRTHAATRAEAAIQGEQVLELLVRTSEEEGKTLPKPKLFDDEFGLVAGTR